MSADYDQDDQSPTSPVDVRRGSRLGDYLGAVRQAVIGGLEGGGADPWRVLQI